MRSSSYKFIYLYRSVIGSALGDCSHRDVLLENILWISGIIGLASAVQSLAGFGFALVAIALLPFFLTLQLAIPLVLIMCLLSSIGLWVYYRNSFSWREVAPLVLSALISIPIGLVGLHYIPEEIARKVLGTFIVMYVMYDIAKLVTPLLRKRRIE